MKNCKKLTNLRFKTILFCMAAALLFYGCGKKNIKVERPPVPVTVAVVYYKDMPLQITTFGNVEAFTTVPVKSMVTGIITTINFKPGQKVKKGDVIVSLDSRPFVAALKLVEANLARDEALYVDVLRQAEMKERLYKSEAIAKDEMKKIRAQSDSLAATILANKANVEKAKLDLEYCSIKAPCDAITGDILIHEGTAVKANDLNMLILNQVDPVYVGFSVPQANLPLIQKFMKEGKLQVIAKVPAEGGITATGELTFIDNIISGVSGTVKLKATFSNSDATLWPGQFVNVTLKLTTQKDCVVVLTHAIQAGQNGNYTFVITPEKTAQLRLLEVERSLEKETIIKSGLNVGETIVTDGHLKLVPDAKVIIQDENYLQDTIQRKKKDEKKDAK